MSKEHLTCEKAVLQKNLLYYEGLHGRPVSINTVTLILSHTQKQVLVPMYLL